MDDAIAELEGMRKAAEADEVAAVQLRKRLVGLQGTLRTTRCDPCYPCTLPCALCSLQSACLSTLVHQVCLSDNHAISHAGHL